MAGKRSIFEEVGTTEKVAATQTGLIDRGNRGARGPIRIWLMILFLLVALMIVVGGMTRLTDSGLSITEWKPVTGAIPPMDEAGWAAEFTKYQASPQYQLMNHGMSVEEFKSIYWWEWGHRQLGRMIGLVWAVGFFGFLLARKIPPGWTQRLLILGILGGAQGAVGWWMVSSGLEAGMVSVASYRLATHLGIAFGILGLIAWYIFLLGRQETDLLQARRVREDRLVTLTTILAVMVFIQVLLGALVAGIDAGRGFPTWPDMNGQFFPADAFYVPGRPAWAAFFENAGLVQFVHRIWAYLTFFFGLFTWWQGRRSAYLATRRAFDWLTAMLLGQVVLGIVTALTAAQPHAAITHQIGAILLWVLVLRARHLSLYPRAGSIRKGTA